MSKYNLSDILNEYIGGGRIGTLKISFKDLQDKMDELEDSGKVIVRTLSGPSGDGKVNREFEVVDRDSAVPGGNKQERGFTVYDYKFGFDPGSEDKFMNEYPFSVGGNDLKLAMELIDGVEEYKFEEAKSENINEGDLFSSKFDRQELKDIINDLNEEPIFDMAVRRAYKFLVSLLDNEDKKELGLNESTGPSDKAETEDDVVNIDKVAGPSAKGVGYGAETSANTAEDDMEDKEVANPRPMYENGDVSDFTSELKEDDVEEQMYIDDDEFEMEMVMDRAKEIAPILKGVDMDIIVDFVKTHRQDIRGASDEEIRDEFEEFRSVNYDYIDEALKIQFKRFM